MAPPSDQFNDTLYRIATALPRFQRLDDLLKFIAHETQALIGVEGASVILLDEENGEFFFRVAEYDDLETGRRMGEIRFPKDKGVAGHVYRTGTPLVVQDTYQSPYFLKSVDDKAGYRTRNMLDVPIRSAERIIGVLCAVNKKGGPFVHSDISRMTAIAGLVALPIENARIHEALRQSYQQVRRFNRAKDRLIHHLSHEIKTPVSVLDASLKLAERRMAEVTPGIRRIFERARRSIDRLLQMQYEIEDLLQGGDRQAHWITSALVASCADLMETAVSEAWNEEALLTAVTKRIDLLFHPTTPTLEPVRLDHWIPQQLRATGTAWQDRNLTIIEEIQAVPEVQIPLTILEKVFDGLVRNAVARTPDHGKITIGVTGSGNRVILSVADNGVGIRDRDLQLITEQYVAAGDTMAYKTGHPYAFGAGGRGFDLLRMHVFAERFGFEIRMQSERCPHLRPDSAACPGNAKECSHSAASLHGECPGGTRVSVVFPTAPDGREKETIADES